MFTKKPIWRGDFLGRGAWTVFQFKAVDWKECPLLRGDGSEGGGGLIPQCTLDFMFTYTFLTFFFLFFINKNMFSLFLFLFYDEVSNICNRTLNNQKPE